LCSAGVWITQHVRIVQCRCMNHTTCAVWCMNMQYDLSTHQNKYKNQYKKSTWINAQNTWINAQKYMNQCTKLRKSMNWCTFLTRISTWINKERYMNQSMQDNVMHIAHWSMHRSNINKNLAQAGPILWTGKGQREYILKTTEECVTRWSMKTSVYQHVHVDLLKKIL